jgi:DNA polymerase III subunit delta'
MPGTAEIKRHLDDAWQSGRLSHAYIISGGSGDERRETADHIATLLLSYRSDRDGRTEESRPVQDQVWMKQLAGGTHPDLIRVVHEKPASISVDDIRQQLSDTIDIRPYETASKLYIIDEAEKMTVQAQNAVLKTIEEPPEYASIVLLTENPELFLETIRSRCVNLKLDPRDDGEQAAQEYMQILRGLGQLRVRELMDAVAGLKEDKDSMPAFIDAARTWLRDTLVLKTTGSREGLLLAGEAEYIEKYAAAMSLKDIERALKAVDEAESRIGSNVNPELTLQLMLMELERR